MSYQKIKGYCIVAAFTVVFYLALSNLQKLSGVFRAVAGLLTPFVIGLIIAFLLGGILRWFERYAFGWLANHPLEKRRRLVRPLSLACSYLLLFLVLGVLISVVTPQLADSMRMLVENIQPFFMRVTEWANDYAKTIELTPEVWAQITAWLEQAMAALFNFVPRLLGMLPEFYQFAVSVGGGVFTFLMGVILSIYMLLDKEHLLEQFGRFGRAFLSKTTVDRVGHLTRITVETLEKYVGGQLLDALIVGVVSVCGLALLRFPYAMLVGTVMGITNIIPFFGPVLGAIPGFLIILTADPVKALWYILFVVIVQQVDGNLLVPRIIGNSVGLPPLWVLFSVIVGGGIFGIPGMILGTPLFAVFYRLTARAVRFQEAQNEATSPPTE